jgi:methionyl-tRNA formyltransferase
VRLIFLGTPAFALPSLDRLVADGHALAAVVTQPDRPAGRGQALRAAPVKRRALALGLPVLQPERIREPAVAERLRALAPEALIVVAYGQLLPSPLLALAPHGCLNVHASLLPAYRGAAPIAWALIRGERETGVSIMRLDAGMDTGPVCLQRAVPVGPDETAGELHDRLAALGAAALAEALRLVAEGRAAFTPQDHGRASLAPRLTPADLWIDWKAPAREVHDRIRGLAPAPGAVARWRGQLLKLLRSAVASEADPPGEDPVAPGTIVGLGAGGIVVRAGRGTVRLLEVQAPGRRVLPAAAFARGARLAAGERLEGERA